MDRNHGSVGAPATLMSSLFAHILSTQGGDSPAAVMLYSWGQSFIRAHRFCWIIWRSQATKPPFFAGLNQAYNSAEGRASFFVWSITMVLMKICDFTNEFWRILSNPDDTKYPGDQRPHVCLCCWVVCVRICVCRGGLGYSFRHLANM